jgi:predicted component of type VI protein secretion system
MTQPHALAVSHLIVLTPGPDRGRRFALTRDHLIIGRADSSDLRLEDLGVSRTHAALRQRDGAVYIQDLGSSGGTFVNGLAATAPHELRAGDVVSLAAVQLRYESGGNADGRTRTMPAVTSQAPRPPDVRARSAMSGATSTTPTSSTSPSSGRVSCGRSRRPRPGPAGCYGPVSCCSSSALAWCSPEA